VWQIMHLDRHVAQHKEIGIHVPVCNHEPVPGRRCPPKTGISQLTSEPDSNHFISVLA
jgi:hypothetical protein